MSTFNPGDHIKVKLPLYARHFWPGPAVISFGLLRALSRGPGKWQPALDDLEPGPEELVGGGSLRLWYISHAYVSTGKRRLHHALDFFCHGFPVDGVPRV
ncbi:MAG: hypothetical protein M1115_05480, partial [Actinobacteria bacterium]|nr:hypothetical protein [Actinomycetota bacterium]